MASLTDISVGSFTKILIAGESGTDYTAIADVNSIGDISESANVISVQEYNRVYLKKLLGSKEAEALDIVLNFNPSDAQHKALFAAYKSGAQTKFKIQMTDASGVNGVEVEFTALVSSKSLSNAFDEVRGATVTLTPAGGEGFGELKDM